MDKYIHRQLEGTIIEASRYFSVIALTGPRQSGKSTLLSQLFPLYDKYSLKDLYLLDYAEHDPIAFLSQTDKGMFIDEIQKCPQLLDYIQGIVDNDPYRRFLLSGSSNFEVMHNLSESLAGRASVFELLPMSIPEIAEQTDFSSLNNVLYNGFYPAICSGKNIAKFFYPSYVRTYLEKDVRDLLQVKDQLLFTKFMKLCAAHIGSIFNASELGAEVGVSSKTISHWLSVLQASYIITLLPPYFENISKRLVKSPKLYFNDPGLACYLLDIETPQQLDRDKMRGAIFENMIVAEALKHRYNKGQEGGVFFYRDSNQNEVDLLIKQGGELTAIDIKSAMTYSSSFEKVISQLDGWIKTPIKQKVIVYSGDYENLNGNVKLINYKHIANIF